MRGFGFAVGIVCSVLSSAAFSEDVRFGDSSVKVSPPKGFCELDKTNKADVTLFESMSNFAKAGGFSVITFYPDCHEYGEWRKSNASILTKVVFTRFAKQIDRPPSQFISEACDQRRKLGIPNELKARISKYVTEFTKGNISQTNTMSLGVLDEIKGIVCYFGQLERYRIANMGDVTLVSLSAGTFVGDQAIAIFQWTNYADETSIDTALANLKTIYSDFVAANGKSP
jgi:hypothetical protein